MGIIEIVLVLAVLGFAAWVILQIPMPSPMPQIIIGVICFAVVIWLLQTFGLIHGHVRL